MIIRPSADIRTRRSWLNLAIIALVLLGAGGIGAYGTPATALLGAALVLVPVIALRRQCWAPLLVLACLVGRFVIPTGTEVRLYSAAVAVPLLGSLWVLEMLLSGKLRLIPSRLNTPLLLFLLSNLISLLIGFALWDPNVPRPPNFTLVQLAQWAVFAFAAIAFWLSADVLRASKARRLALWTFLFLAGGLALAMQLPALGHFVAGVASPALSRAPFWLLLGGLAGGQLLFNRDLARPHRIWLSVVVASIVAFVFTVQRDNVSTWLGLVVVAVVLFWQRFARLRWLASGALALTLLTGSLLPALYDFAGGDREARGSGESRVILSTRVIEETMRNPITGLGPAAYRPYTRMQPLPFYQAYWIEPNISAHNNYVDLFAHGGVLGLGLFLWFLLEYARLAIRLQTRQMNGLDIGLRAGMLAVGSASVVIMMLADWILPFVYNIGFDGFQASVLVWLFAGSLVALDASDTNTALRGAG